MAGETIETTVKMDSEAYNDFLGFITNIKDICMDLDIRDGLVRQRSDDKNAIFEVDLSPILPGVSMALTDLKKKLDLLKIFQGQDEVTVKINETENGSSTYTFSDNMSSIKILAPSLDFVDNKFMSSEELENIFTLNEEDLILDYDLQTMITERIRTITASFNVFAIQVNFDGEEASISSTTPAKDQHAKLVTGIISNIDIEKSSANLSIIPFSIDYDTNVLFKMYKDPAQNVCLNLFESNLGTLAIKIFTRASLVKVDEG